MAYNFKQPDFTLLKQLTETPGLPGRENLVGVLIQQMLPEKNWDVRVDAVGNITARKPGSGKKLLLIAHMDEVGLIVRKITPEGFLKVERLGGVGLETLPGSAFDLWTAQGRFDAQVGCLAAHLENGHFQPPNLAEMYIDVGASSKAEVLNWGINIGDGLTWRSTFCTLPGKRVRSKALDDRLGCFALVKLAEEINQEDLDYDISLAFVCQEESMILESAPVIKAVDPDVVIGLDGTLTFDTPQADEGQNEIGLGAGPAIKLMDAIRGKTAYLPDWSLTNKMIRFMESQGLPVQREVVVNFTTALSLVPFMNLGIATACLSIPIRYHHSPVEVADLEDFEMLVNGLRAMLIEHVF